MSATNRGTVRKEHDFYATPVDVVENLLKFIDLSNVSTILEPSAGSGNVLTPLSGDFNITSCEIREEELDTLDGLSQSVIIDDFMTHDFTDKYDLIIGNPPYSKAIEFVEKSLSLLSENGKLVFLLRTAFLESKKRYEFWQENPLSDLLVLSKRPSFTGKGTDATSYSWFVWINQRKNNGLRLFKTIIIDNKEK